MWCCMHLWCNTSQTTYGIQHHSRHFVIDAVDNNQININKKIKEIVSVFYIWLTITLSLSYYSWVLNSLWLLLLLHLAIAVAFSLGPIFPHVIFWIFNSWSCFHFCRVTLKIIFSNISCWRDVSDKYLRLPNYFWSNPPHHCSLSLHILHIRRVLFVY